MRAKKLMAVMLSAVLAFSLVACGENKGTTDNASTDSTTTEESGEASGTEESSDAEAPAAAGGNKVGIAMPTKSLERWNRDGSYLEEQFKSKVMRFHLPTLITRSISRLRISRDLSLTM